MTTQWFYKTFEILAFKSCYKKSWNLWRTVSHSQKSETQGKKEKLSGGCVISVNNTSGNLPRNNFKCLTYNYFHFEGHLEHFLLCDNLCRRCDFHRLNFCHISYHRGLILLWHKANLRFHVHQGKSPVPDADILGILNSSLKSFFDEILKKRNWMSGTIFIFVQCW